jgi:hypothetical protein
LRDHAKGRARCVLTTGDFARNYSRLILANQDCAAAYFRHFNLLLLPPVVQLRRPGRFMIGDILRHFQFAAVLQVGGDAADAEGMIADLRLDAGGLRPPLDHAIGILLVHGFFP